MMYRAPERFKATKHTAIALAPLCLLYCVLAIALGAVWYGPVVIFGGIWTLCVGGVAILEF